MGFFDWFEDETDEKKDKKSIEGKSDFSNFNQVTDYIYENCGITDLDTRAITSSKFQQEALNKGIYTSDEFLFAMKNNSDFYQDIINIATINETFFLREVKELEWLIEYIKEQNRPLEILCIPSSSGEEIYSILLMMQNHKLNLNNVKITGYDINSYAIKDALAGEYNEHSLHKLDDKMKEKYFTKQKNNRYQISHNLKKYVSFMQKNIFELDHEKKQFDIILSRNMFIYFDEINRSKALDIIIKLLKVDGIYIKGHADYIKPHRNLKNIEFGIYRKI